MSIRGMPALREKPAPLSRRQLLFLYYFTCTLTDLVVLGLFAAYSNKVHVEGFGILLLAAGLLQILLKLAIALEHRWNHYCAAKVGKFWRFSRFFGAWLILFVSKFAVLESLSFTFGDKVRFEGALHGLVWLIIVVTTMLVVEELLMIIFRKLADPQLDPEGDLNSEGR